MYRQGWHVSVCICTWYDGLCLAVSLVMFRFYDFEVRHGFLELLPYPSCHSRDLVVTRECMPLPHYRGPLHLLSSP